jgi:fructokinase
MAADARILARERLATPQEDYRGQVATIAALVRRMEQIAGQTGISVGVGHPGATIPATGRIKNANSQCLNGQPLQADLEAVLARRIRMANDADCLAVSEAADGAAAGAQSVFAVILGTGVGGGAVINGQLLRGANGIASEWGHNPLPWPRTDWGEVPGPLHWDGRHGAIEAWLSGPALAEDHFRCSGERLSGAEIAHAAAAGAATARATLNRYYDRLARALATIINLLDPEVIVFGGGVSRLPKLCAEVQQRLAAWVFTPDCVTNLVTAQHGDSSGVRGAAWLWGVGPSG